MRGVVRFVVLTVVAGLSWVLGVSPAHAAEIVIIQDIKVGSPVMQTKDECRGYMSHSDPVVPMTVVATFIPPPGQEPTGPYATGMWSGGFGSWDNHFGTSQGKAHTQFFHILLRSSRLNGYHGAGDYTVTSIVQDVGLAGGFAEKTESVYLPPPSPGGAKVKCTMTQPLGPQFVLDQIKDAAIDQIRDHFCPVCGPIKDALSTLQTYSEILDHYTYKAIADDPPDPDYQLAATPQPPPLLPAPAGLTSEQTAAYSQLVASYAKNIGLSRALFTTVNRLWGANNAASDYWYDFQLRSMADLADQQAAALDELPALWDALARSMEADLSGLDVSVDGQAVATNMANYLDGLPDGHATTATALGESPASQRDIADTIVAYANLDEVEPTPLMTALFATTASELAGSFRIMRNWAQSALEEARPVVSEVTPNRVRASGGNLVTVKGLNLQSVSGINFGPSTTTTGQGDILSCSDDECSVYAPPGHGTVDVVAIGPGGPSAIRPSTKFTYADGVPAVTGVFPSSGRLLGHNEVTIFGTGLDGGTPYFGPSMASSWICFEDRCRAWPQESVNPATVDVTVKTDAGRSPIVAGAQYTFSDEAPPPAEAPAITALTPDRGSDLGGDRVTITGSGFTGATSVRFGGDWGRNGTDLLVLSDTQLKVTTPWGEVGSSEVLVYGPGGVSAPASFTYADEQPVITSVTPSSGPNIGGTQVTVLGSGLSSGAFIEVGGAFVRDEVCTATKCTFTTPPVHQDDPQTGPLDINISTSNGDTVPGPAGKFTYTDSPDPVVTEVVADTGTKYGGTKVVVLGENLGGGTVTFGGVPAEVQDFPEWCSMQSCIVRIPPNDAGPVSVVVKTPGGQSVPDDRSTFTYVRPAKPVITSVTPSSGLLNSVDDVTIHGHNLEHGVVYFGNATSQPDCTASECALPYPPVTGEGRTPGVVDVRVETPAGISDITDVTKYEFTVPTVTSVSPTSGWNDGQQEVTVTGTGLTGARVLFDGRMSASEACTEDTTCTVLATRTTDVGEVDVQVAADGGSTRSLPGPDSRFTYVTRPMSTITSVTPSTGTISGGDSVTVDGTDLFMAEVTLGGYTVTEECTNTRCTFKTPARAAGSYGVQVRTTAGTTPLAGAPTFTYAVPPPPTITSVSPDRGTTLGGTRVTVNGTNLVGSQIQFGNVAGAEEQCTRTTCTVVTTKRAAGPVDVVATTAGGASAPGSATYTYELPPVPVVTAVSPAMGPATGGQKVTITGEHLFGSTIRFGGVAVPFNQVTCTASECTAVQPPGAPGTVQVTATTEGRTSTTSASFTNTDLRADEVVMPGTDPTALGGGVVTRGVGGDVWFTSPKRDEVGRIQGDGTVTTFPTADSSEPLGITLGPDGRMWFTEKRTNRIVAISADGTQQNFPLPGTAGEGAYDLRHITSGPDGRLWFTLSTSGVIGAMSTSGDFELFHLPDPYVVPYHLRTGPDGRIWFTEWGGQAVGAITVDGEVTEYAVPGERGVSWDIVEGLDGRMWFTQAIGRALVAVDSGGRVEIHELPPRAANPQGLTVGPDGRLWFVAPDVDQLGAYDTSTRQLTTYPLPPGQIRGPKYVAMDRGGALWVNTLGSSRLFRVSGLPAATPTVTNLSQRYGAAGDEVVVAGSHLGGATAVTVGGTSATFDVLDPAHLRLTVPPGAGPSPVRVTTPLGTSATSEAATFTYGPPPAPQPQVTKVSPAFGLVAGGTSVTVTGRDLAGGTVHFGEVQATGSCSPSECVVTAPPHAVGTVDVSVSTAGGLSEVGDHARFTYQEPPPTPPTLTSVAPNKGPNTGGTEVTITGTNLAGGLVTFGTRSVPSTCTQTQCTATSPPAGAGLSTVRVTTAGGITPVNDASAFTYEATGLLETISLIDPGTGSKVYGDYLGIETRVIPSEASGTMVLRSGSTVVGTGALENGKVYISAQYLPVGTHQLTAHYEGSLEHAPSTSQPVTFTVEPGMTETETSLTSSPVKPVAGQQATLTATVTPAGSTGTVTFEVDGGDGVEVEVDATGKAVHKVTFPSVGEHEVSAWYSGDDTHEWSAAHLTLDVVSGTTTSPSPSPSPSPGPSPGPSAPSSPGPSPTSPPPTTAPAPTSRPPAAPRSVKAKPSRRSAKVSWKPPSDVGSSPIQRYLVTVYKGRKKVDRLSTTRTSIKVKKLKPRKKYVFRVVAVNAAGSSPMSAKSKVIKPLARTITPEARAQVSWWIGQAPAASALTGSAVTMMLERHAVPSQSVQVTRTRPPAPSS